MGNKPSNIQNNTRGTPPTSRQGYNQKSLQTTRDKHASHPRILDKNDEDAIHEIDTDEFSGNKSRKPNQKKAILVCPYNQDAVESGFISPIRHHLQQSKAHDANPHDGPDNPFVKLKNCLHGKDIVEYVSEMESEIENAFYGQNLTDQIRGEFLKYSKENKMGKMRFMSLLRIETTTLGGNEGDFLSDLFKAVLNVLDLKDAGDYMDYSKILRFMHLMLVGTEDDRLKFFFSLFDMNGDGKVEKDELADFMQAFLEFLLQTPFGDAMNGNTRGAGDSQEIRSIERQLSNIKGELLKCKEKDLAAAVQDIAFDISSKYSKAGTLTFDEWSNWIQKDFQFKQLYEMQQQNEKQQQQQQYQQQHFQSHIPHDNQQPDSSIAHFQDEILDNPYHP